ncbi:MFS transporter [Crenobacter cavernae]|uniref:MFS transporter n=1 Tax=Crenobacter cavernae TaxID=2290923 RepID=A0A345Y4H9_9NEIS|nr:MFS transporter [Crenobacter cavernae]AXK38831.1 MFS transporter [Crenobacter cavernae]
MTAELPADTPALRHHRPFLAFWFARVFTTGGFQMLSVAIGWQMYALTGSALDLGLVGLVQFLPRVLLVLVTGDVADRFDRRRVLGVSLLVQAAVAFWLAAGSAGLSVSRELIFFLAAVIGTARSFDMPTMQALLPNVVPPKLLSPAIAAAAAATEAATIIAPALGGFLYAAGAPVAYGVGTVVYLIAALLVLNISARPQTPRDEKLTLDSLFAGVRFIRSRPDILGAISLDLFAVLLGGATALLPVYARDILHTGPWGLGLLRAAPALGALAMSAWLIRHPIRRRVGRVMFAAVGVFGVATVVFGVSTSFWLSMAVLVILGASDMVSVVIRASFVQLETPDAMRGRVGSVNSLFIGASNQLGEFESGATAALMGTVPAVVAGGLGTLAVVAIWMKCFPSLAHRDRLSGPE